MLLYMYVTHFHPSFCRRHIKTFMATGGCRQSFRDDHLGLLINNFTTHKIKCLCSSSNVFFEIRICESFKRIEVNSFKQLKHVTEFNSISQVSREHGKDILFFATKKSYIFIWNSPKTTFIRQKIMSLRAKIMF